MCAQTCTISEYLYGHAAQGAGAEGRQRDGINKIAFTNTAIDNLKLKGRLDKGKTEGQYKSYFI